LPSEVAGPAFLAIILAVAALIAFQRRRLAPDAARVAPAAALAIGIQALHVAEEFWGGFHVRVPALLGLQPWSPAFFLSFNLAWLGIWAFALAWTSAAGPRVLSMAVLWFLALASVGNGIWHPLLALATGGYFPGLLTSLLTLPAGLLLARRLLAA
jgi:hypothetical protein